MKTERRQFSRARLNWPVSVHIEEEIFERVTFNIGSNGAFIRGISPIDLHEVVDLTLMSPDRPIAIKARVIWWRNEVPQGPGEDLPRGMGVEFIKISNEDREFILAFVSGFDFALYLEPQAPESKEDSLLDGNLPEQKENEEESENPHKLPNIKCPQGHIHVSWSADEGYLICWDCNRRYDFAECRRTENGDSSSFTVLEE